MTSFVDELSMALFEAIAYKFNENHDELGRFASGDGGGSDSGNNSVSSGSDFVENALGNSIYAPKNIDIKTDSEMPGQTDPAMQHIASYSAMSDTLSVNSDSEYFKLSDNAKKQYAAKQYRLHKWSTDDPNHPINHELGHAAHAKSDPRAYSTSGYLNDNQMNIAAEVSYGSLYSSQEFVAETFAGLRGGKTYSEPVMKMYSDLGGPSNVH